MARLTRRGAALAGALALLPLPVPAQTAADDGPGEELPTIAVPEATEPAAEEGVRLEDVVVTAAKRPAHRRDLPASIDALDGRALEAAGALQLRDYLRQIPGIALTEIFTDLARIAVRGIQTDVTANTAEATGFFIDDVPLNDPYVNQARPDLPPFDLDGVEVIKGPQGTLFGGSSLAGAVRYKLADARPGAWESRAFVQYQDVAEGSPTRVGGAALNAPLGDAAALRLVGVQRASGGVIDDVRNGVSDTDHGENTSARALLRWDATDAVRARLKVLRQDASSNDLSVTENVEGRLERERALRPASPSATRFDIQALDMDWDLPGFTVASRTSRLGKEARYANANAERTLGVEDAGRPIDAAVAADIEALVQELRLVSPEQPGGDWRWLAGVFVHDYAGVTTQRVYHADSSPIPEPDLLDFRADVRARELAVFGEATWRFAERWRVTAGARGYRAETNGTVVSTGAIILATGSPENRNEAQIRAQGVSPKLALQLDAAANLGAYASVARGFRFGGIQIVGPSPVSPDVPTTFDSDRVWSYELGVRSEWLDDTVEIDAAVFRIDWEDPQVNTTTGGAVPLNVIDNVDSALSEGVEVALRWLSPVPGLRLELAGALIDARTNVPFTAPNGATVPAGARLPGYADAQGVATMRYARALGAWSVDAALTHAAYGKGVSDVLQSIELYGHHATDAWLGFRAEAWALAPRLAFGVTNLTDERAVVSALVQNADNYTTVYNRPRTLELRLDLGF